MNEPIDLDTLQTAGPRGVVDFLKRGGYAQFGTGSDVDRLLDLVIQIAELYVRNACATAALSETAERGLRGDESWAMQQRHSEMTHFVTHLRKGVGHELWGLRGSMAEFMI